MKVTREVVEFGSTSGCFPYGTYLHMPLFLMLIAAGIVHVISVHVY